jgi:FAD synthase
MKSFKEFLSEAKGKTVVFTFGRFQPVTSGHSRLIDKVKEVARKNSGEARIYISNSHDKKNNPLPPKEKQKIMKSLFSGAKIILDPNLRNAFEIVDKGFPSENVTKAILIVGSDRVDNFKKELIPFAETKGIEMSIVSAGQRDPDAEGVTGISGSKMREFAKNDDFKSFKEGLPKTSDLNAKKIFKTLQDNL